MPLPPAYDLLRECARRRIEEEWDLTGREQTVLRVIELASFGCGQKKAHIPTQALLATACGLHRSDVCRALKRLITMGALSFIRHREDALYEIEVHCDTVPRRTQVTTQEREAAMAAILELQERRRGGRADPNGQERLYGVLGPAEDAALETDALRAALEPNAERNTPTVERNTLGVQQNSPRPQEPELDPAEVTRHMDEFRRRMAAGSGSRSSASWSGRGAKSTSPAGERDNLDRYKLGLDPEQSHLWDCLVTEIQRGSAVGWSEFVQYAPLWRKRLLEHPAALREAISDHKLRAKGSADLPGAYIFNRMRVATEGTG